MKVADVLHEEEPHLRHLPFRGSTLGVWSDTPAGQLAVIAHLSLADARLDAFYEAAGVELKDTKGRIVFPPPPKRTYGSERKDGNQEKAGSDPGAGEAGPAVVALPKPKGGDSVVARSAGAGSSPGDAAPGPEETDQGGDLFDLFGVE